MAANWPGTLPQRFLRDGNSEALGENRVASATEVGAPLLRPRSSRAPGEFSGAMRMTGAQWAILLAFGQDDLGKWTMPFSIPSSDGGVWLAQFKSKPARTNIGGDRWTVSMSLVILP